MKNDRWKACRVVLTRATTQKILTFVQIDFSAGICLFFAATAFSPVTMCFTQKLNINSLISINVSVRSFYASVDFFFVSPYKNGYWNAHKTYRTDRNGKCDAKKKLSHLLINRWKKKDHGNKNRIKSRKINHNKNPMEHVLDGFYETCFNINTANSLAYFNRFHLFFFFLKHRWQSCSD